MMMMGKLISIFGQCGHWWKIILKRIFFTSQVSFCFFFHHKVNCFLLFYRHLQRHFNLQKTKTRWSQSVAGCLPSFFSSWWLVLRTFLSRFRMRIAVRWRTCIKYLNMWSVKFFCWFLCAITKYWFLILQPIDLGLNLMKEFPGYHLYVYGEG